MENPPSSTPHLKKDNGACLNHRSWLETRLPMYAWRGGLQFCPSTSHPARSPPRGLWIDRKRPSSRDSEGWPEGKPCPSPSTCYSSVGHTKAPENEGKGPGFTGSDWTCRDELTETDGYCPGHGGVQLRAEGILVAGKTNPGWLASKLESAQS